METQEWMMEEILYRDPDFNPDDSLFLIVRHHLGGFPDAPIVGPKRSTKSRNRASSRLRYRLGELGERFVNYVAELKSVPSARADRAGVERLLGNCAPYSRIVDSVEEAVRVVDMCFEAGENELQVDSGGAGAFIVWVYWND